MIATSGFLTALECTKFVFGLGAGGAYSAPKSPYSWYKVDPTFKGKWRRGKKGRGGNEKEERGGNGGERRGSAPQAKFLDPPLMTVT